MFLVFNTLKDSYQYSSYKYLVEHKWQDNKRYWYDNTHFVLNVPTTTHRFDSLINSFKTLEYMYLKQKYVVRIFQKDIEFLSKTHTCRDFLQMRQLIIFTPFSPFKGSPLEQVFSKDINFCNKQKRKQINIEVCFHCPKEKEIMMA